MKIETETTVLRHFQTADLEAVGKMGSEPTIVTQLNMAPFQSSAEAQAFLTMLMNDADAWAIVDRSSQMVQGLMMLAPTLGEDGQTLVAYELSFALLPVYQRRGIMSAVLPATMAAYWQTQGVATFNAACFLDNQASQASLLKAGFNPDFQTQLPDFLGGQVVQYYRRIMPINELKK